ncbi:adenylate/guanylate cyclase domain-containing protein, partial [Variovorax soli]
MSACPNCGAAREASHRFCPNCGARLDAQRELKQVTVLLADLCGSTEQVVRTDAEGGQAYLDEALRLMSEAVNAYGGTQVQWRGDELLALFGAPVAQEDHALRACLAAIAMAEAMKAQSSAQAPMAVRIGIDSGEVIAGPGSGHLATSYRVDGAPVHLASRLEKLAPPASTYISGNTLQLLHGQLETRALGPFNLRGFDAPVDIHELVGSLQDSAAGPLARRRFLAPLVGRAQALADLMQLAEGVRRTGLRAV